MWTSDMHHSHQDPSSNHCVLNANSLKSRGRRCSPKLSPGGHRGPCDIQERSSPDTGYILLS